MNGWVEMVAEFHRKFGVPVHTVPALRRVQLRASLIHEESQETLAALAIGDLVGAADGLVDLIYVSIGAALEFGIDLEPLFAEVHASNLRKEGGATRPDGKCLKPPGWIGPRIAELIEAQRMAK